MPRSSPNPTDLRVIKTRQAIHDSFIALLSEHDYRDITIRHILDKAQINRTTFYKHYTNKHALAQQMMQDLLHPLLSQWFERSMVDFLSRLIDDLAPHYAFIFVFWGWAPHASAYKAPSTHSSAPSTSKATPTQRMSMRTYSYKNTCMHHLPWRCLTI